MADGTRPDLADTATDVGVRTPPERPITRALTNEPHLRGSAVGRYLVLERLGAGGMGVVYAAYDPELDRKIALKVVRYERGSRAADSEGRARMQREAQALARLAHPNVVAAYDVGTDADGQLFIAMELVDGCTLAAWLAIEPRSTAEILDMFAQAGRGLAAAHGAGLIHRDFKPDNVLVGNDGRARVVDFGLVRAVGGEPTHDTVRDVSPAASPALEEALTQVGAVMGTPMYMAPEQLLHGAVDARTDQYSFCVALYEALADTRPFKGETFGEIAEQVLAGKVAEPKSTRKLPNRVRAAIKRGMSVEREERFASMNELIATLTREERTRRNWAIAISAAVVIVGVTSIGWLSRSQDVAPCGDAARELADVWGPERRAEMQRAFIATGLPFAQTQFATANRTLDKYAQAWTAKYEDSCKATHVRREQSAEMLDQRTACLHNKRTAFATLIDLLRNADKQLVQGAHRSTAELPSVDDCDVVVLAAPIKPADPVTAAAVQHQRGALAKTVAMRIAGKYRESQPQTEAVYAAARALRYGPLIAEASEQLAQNTSLVGDSIAATRLFIEAFGAAAASHADQTAMRIAVYVATTYGRRETFDQAHAWLDVATSYIERLGNSPPDRARIHYARGYIYDSEGKITESLSEHQRSLELRERTVPGSLELGRSLSSVARAYDELGRYDEARAAAERGLAIHEAILGLHHPEIAVVLTTTGNILVDQGDLDAAQRLYVRALAILEPSPGKFVNPTYAANVITNLGAIAFERNNYDDALAYHRRALAIYESVPDNGPDIANSLSNIGAVLVARAQIPEALVAFQRSLAAAEPKLGKDHPFVGDALVGIGECLLQLKRYAEARSALERGLAIRKRGSRPLEMATVQIALAKTLWAQGERARAIELARTARDAFATTPGTKTRLDDTDAWLRKHGAR